MTNSKTIPPDLTDEEIANVLSMFPPGALMVRLAAEVKRRRAAAIPPDHAEQRQREVAAERRGWLQARDLFAKLAYSWSGVQMRDGFLLQEPPALPPDADECSTCDGKGFTTEEDRATNKLVQQIASAPVIDPERQAELRVLAAAGKWHDSDFINLQQPANELNSAVAALRRVKAGNQVKEEVSNGR